MACRGCDSGCMLIPFITYAIYMPHILVYICAVYDTTYHCYSQLNSQEKMEVALTRRHATSHTHSCEEEIADSCSAMQQGMKEDGVRGRRLNEIF